MTCVYGYDYTDTPTNAVKRGRWPKCTGVCEYCVFCNDAARAVLYPLPLRNPPQHCTAQHSTAQHSTEHGSARHTTQVKARILLSSTLVYRKKYKDTPTNAVKRGRWPKCTGVCA